MYIIRIFFVTCLSLLLGLASAQVPANKLDTNAIDTYITAKMRLPRFPGMSLAIVKGDKIIYLKGYGKADPAGHPVTPQTPFIIGSVTKSFTALAVMQLVEAGKVDLNAPVQRYIPWFGVADPGASAKITVEQLLHQTSGLPMIRKFQLWKDLDDEALERTVRYLKKTKLDYPPGQSFSYSNSNYEILGLIVQVVSGQSFEEYVEQHIFKPLDMRNSFASQNDAMKHGMATGYRWWFGIPVPAHLHFNRSELPAGYIIASAEDMAHYIIAQMNGGSYADTFILSPTGITMTQAEPASTAYAMGWEHIRTDGHTLINHDGGTANFQCSVFFDPEEKVGVFLSSNIMGGLDAFSSPHGGEPLDGLTTRGIAHSVLNMVIDRPLPKQGRGLRQLYIFFDLVILTLTILLVVSLLRIPRRMKRWKQRSIVTRSALWWRIGLVAALHFTWPLVILYLSCRSILWKALFMFQPDLDYWLQTLALIILLKGLFETGMILRVLRITPPGYNN